PYPKLALFLLSLALLFGIVWFARRPEFWRPMMRPSTHFLLSKDTNDWNARRCLFAGATLLMLLLLGTGRINDAARIEHGHTTPGPALLLLGVVFGLAFALLQPHPQRILASVSIGWLALCLGFLFEWLGPEREWPVLLVGFATAWPLVSLEAALFS